MTSLRLRPYQEETIVSVRKQFVAGKKRQLVVLPTGAGKTVVFATLIARRRKNNPSKLPTLVLAHRDELINQAAEKILEVEPQLASSIGYIKGKRNDVGHEVIVASVQTLSKQRRLDQLPPRFQTIVVDEAHHAASDSYVRILDSIEAELVLGVTATPDRSDNKRLDKVFDVVATEISIEKMILAGYLVPPRGKRIAVEVDLDDVKQSGGDFQAGDLADALEAANAPTEVLAAYLEHGENRTGLIFTPTVAQAYATAETFRAAGVAVEALDGRTPAKERKEILNRLARGETRLVANAAVLTEGYDEPSIGCIIMASPTRSASKYCQIIGRGLRLHPSKTDCLILDLAGASDELSIQSLPAFFGLKDEEEDVRDAIARHELEDAERDSEGADEQKPAKKKKGTRVSEVGFFPRERLHWIRVEGGWVLDLGEKKQLVLRAVDKKESGWQVLLVNQTTRTFSVRGQHKDIGFGQGIAEEIVREEGLLKIVDRNASWRRVPVTNTQKAALKRMRIKGSPANAGEASNLIAAAQALQTLNRIDRALRSRSTSRLTKTEDRRQEMVGTR